MQFVAPPSSPSWSLKQASSFLHNGRQGPCRKVLHILQPVSSSSSGKLLYLSSSSEAFSEGGEADAVDSSAAAAGGPSQDTGLSASFQSVCEKPDNTGRTERYESEKKDPEVECGSATTEKHRHGFADDGSARDKVNL